MRYILQIILSVIVFNASAQLRTGIRTFYGRSIILNDQTPIRPPTDTYPTAYDHNFGGGAYLQYGFKKWFGIETGVNVEQFRTYEGYFNKATTENLNAADLVFDENGLADYYSAERWMRINYLSFPLGVEFRTGRWKFGLGGQFSYVLNWGASTHFKIVGIKDDYYPFEWNKETYHLRYKKYNVTAYALIGFKFWDNLSVELKYLEGLIDCSTEIVQHRFWTRQFQFGLTYEIWPRKIKNWWE